MQSTHQDQPLCSQQPDMWVVLELLDLSTAGPYTFTLLAGEADPTAILNGLFGTGWPANAMLAVKGVIVSGMKSTLYVPSLLSDT